MNEPHQNNHIKNYFWDCMAVVVATTPVYAVLEVHILYMSIRTSLNARIFTAFLTFLGLGAFIAIARDYSHRCFKLMPGLTSDRIILIHDFIFVTLINGALAPIMYFLSGATTTQLLHGTYIAMAVSFVTGPL